tara:strand:- start:310 stop:576 length:267 start_codon:yes stop_codon:yes gene_type:complete
MWTLYSTEELEQFILDFQAKAMETSSVHPFTNKIISHGWHSETIIRACIKEFGEEGIMANEGIVNAKMIAKDAKEFIINQAKKGKDNE